MASPSCQTSPVDYLRVFRGRILSRLEAVMAEQTPLVRQWTLLKILSSRRQGVTVMEMADELGVHEKTIRRDLETFQQAGFPLDETVCDHGRKKWRLDPDKSQSGMIFTFDEAVALYLGRRFLEPLAGTVLWQAAQNAFRKIRASLSAETLKYLERFATMFHQTMVRGDYSQKADLIDTLMVGIEDRRAVFITYQSLRATEPVSYDIYPYGFSFHRGSLYLVGHSPDHNAIRHWKVDRIEAAELTQFIFQRPADFNLKKHFAQSFGIFHGHGDVRICIRFSPTVARYVSESTWHPSQRLTPQPDGSLLAEFRLSSTEEIKRWVMSFGKEAEVVEPEGLRREAVEELRRSLDKYSPESSLPPAGRVGLGSR